MYFNRLKNPLLLLCAAVTLLGGCAAQQPQQARRYVWPRPPDQPRIEYIRSYYSQNDFPKSGMEKFTDMIFGEAEPRRFEKPIDIKSNGKGVVYITDIALAGIMVYDLGQNKLEFWNRGTDPENSLAINPYYIALDKENNIYAVGQGSKTIYVLDSRGAVVRRINYAEQIDQVAGIAVNSAADRIYLVDYSGSKVAVFSLAGKHLFSFGSPGEKDGEFNRPSPITVNSKGEVLVGDVMNARVQIFSPDGKFLRKFGERSTSPDAFQIIKGVATDSEDNVYVTDGKANQIKIFNTKGEYLLTIGAAHSVTRTMKDAPGGFLLPQGIHIDETDTIYIADQANMRFQIYKYLGGSGEKAADEGSVKVK